MQFFKHKHTIRLAFIVACSIFLSSCASVRTVKVPPDQTPPPLPPVTLPPVQRQNVTHVVGPGETLWRISKMYDVPIATIMKVNRITDTQALEMGQELTIPDAAEYRPVIALFPSNKWQYIIIHHSATDVGSSLAFHHAHLQKGWDKGVGYHFVIDNDSDGKAAGQIEASPRWIKQQDGAHCKAADMNIRGIGICLVGNFDTDKVSSNQMESLVFLVRKLMEFYKIPPSRVLGHGRVEGAATDCPGSRFPWEQFYNRIK